MKVVHICSNDIGGAALAAKRLHRGLLQGGVDSSFVSKYKHKAHLDNHIFMMRHKSLKHYFNFGLEHFIFKNIFPPHTGYSPETVLFSSPHSLLHPELLEVILNADLIHLHWTSHFVDYQLFFENIHKPIVWTLHDMFPFTGGCHYSGDCLKYIQECKDCPQIRETRQPGAAKEYFDYKVTALKNCNNLTLVSPSQWMINQSKESFLFKEREHHQIPNGFDTKIFKVLDRHRCKEKWRIPLNKISLLFVAHSINTKTKGFDILLGALELLPEERFHATFIGREIPDITLMKVSYTTMGYILEEHKMAELYNAADLFITPSLRDNLPNTVAESLLCGTPVLGFKIGGLPEMLINGKNGILADEVSAKGIADGILSYVNLRDNYITEDISQEAKGIYDLSMCTIQYNALYQKLVK